MVKICLIDHGTHITSLMYSVQICEEKLQTEFQTRYHRERTTKQTTHSYTGVKQSNIRRTLRTEDVAHNMMLHWENTGTFNFYTTRTKPTHFTEKTF